MAAPRLAGRIDFGKFLRDVLHHLGHAAAGFIPCLLAELVELGAAPVRIHVLLDKVELADWNVNLLLLGKGQQHEVALETTRLDLLQAPVAADSVIKMHHEIALVEIVETARPSRHGHPLQSALACFFPKNLLLGDKCKAHLIFRIQQAESRGHLPHDNRQDSGGLRIPAPLF